VETRIIQGLTPTESINSDSVSRITSNTENSEAGPSASDSATGAGAGGEQSAPVREKRKSKKQRKKEKEEIIPDFDKYFKPLLAATVQNQVFQQEYLQEMRLQRLAGNGDSSVSGTEGGENERRVKESTRRERKEEIEEVVEALEERIAGVETAVSQQKSSLDRLIELAEANWGKRSSGRKKGGSS
jgi:hypothetical protein